QISEIIGGGVKLQVNGKGFGPVAERSFKVHRQSPDRQGSLFETKEFFIHKKDRLFGKTHRQTFYITGTVNGELKPACGNVDTALDRIGIGQGKVAIQIIKPDSRV